MQISELPRPKLCRYCCVMEGYGTEGSMRCALGLSRADTDAATCKAFYFYDENCEYCSLRTRMLNAKKWNGCNLWVPIWDFRGCHKFIREWTIKHTAKGERR